MYYEKIMKDKKGKYKYSIILTGKFKKYLEILKNMEKIFNFKKIYNFFDINQFKMLIYSAINLMLLFLLNENYLEIKNFFKELSINDDVYKFIILIPLVVFSIYATNFRIVNRKFNRNLSFWFNIFAFQLFSISKQKNNLINVGEMIILTILFFILTIVEFYRMPLSDEKEKKYKKSFWLLILIELLFIFAICLTIILNQIDIIKLINEAYLKNKKISSIKFIYILLKLSILIYLTIFAIFKIFPNEIEKNELNKIEGRQKKRNKYQQFNKEIIEKIKNNSSNINNFEFQNQNVKEEFLYMLKNEFGREYKIYYKKIVYYFSPLHFIINIGLLNCIDKMKIFFKPIKLRILIIDGSYTGLKKLKHKFDVVINILKKDDMIKTRIRDIENLQKEIYIGKNSILVNNLWGSGKTFFINKFMEYNSKNFEFVYIKVPYFNTKEEFRTKLLKEIHKIFKKNKIMTTSLTDLMTYFGISLNTIDLKFFKIDFNNLLLQKSSVSDYRKLLLDVKENLRYLDKKIVVILDDFDRIEDKNQIKEILSFVGELILDLEDNISLITLSSQEVLLKTLEIENKQIKENYLNKYFDKIFYLSNYNFFELLDFFSENYGIDSRKRELVKEMAKLIIIANENLLKNEEVNFRNIERFVKNLKKIQIRNIKKEYVIIYEKVFIFWEMLEYLITEYWNAFKEIDKNLNKENFFNKKVFYDEIRLKYNYMKDLPNIDEKNVDKLIDSIFESVRKYKMSEYHSPISHYIEIKDNLLNLSEIKQKFTLLEYLEASEIFSFNFEERKSIFNFFMDNKSISQYEVLKLIGSYHLDFHWKYTNSEKFFKELEKDREKGERLVEDIGNKNTYDFLKCLLIVNGFIDSGKVEIFNEKEKELYLKNEKTSYFLKSEKEFYDYFVEFAKDKTNKDDFEYFINEILKFRDANFYQRTYDEKITIENLKDNIIQVVKLFFDGKLEEYLKEKKKILKKLKYIESKFGSKVLNQLLQLLKKEDNGSFKIFKDEIEKKTRE